ncbi:MAG: Flp pilus assembly protein CpaB [Candidatus Omnitrophica bacterium]|nr:Flp pilus assembly protein CpaB [Candidatus Omnitrophota bacterium]
MAPAPDQLRRTLPFIIAVVTGLTAAVLNWNFLTKQRRALEAERQRLLADFRAPVEVVVAARDLAPEVTLEASHFAPAVIPEKFVQPYAARAPEEIIGLVTQAPIAEGEQILRNKLRRPDEAPLGSRLSTVTPKGKRAVTIAVDTLTGVGKFVRPGDLVDVLWTLQLPGPGEGMQPVTLTLFQDVPVLAVGGETLVGGGQAPAAGGEGASEAGAGAVSGQFTVTMALDPQETSFLLFAREQGGIQLSLRPRSETGTRVSVVPANIGTLLEQQLGISAQGPPPPRQVEVYKGLEKGVVEVTESSR